MVEDIRKANIEEGAKEIAGLLDQSKVGAAADRLSEDWMRMTPAEFGALMRDINKQDQKGVGWDLHIDNKEGRVTAEDQSSRLRTFLGSNNRKWLGNFNPGGLDESYVPQAPSSHENDGGRSRFIHAGAGFAEAADKRASELAKAHKEALNEKAKSWPELRK